MKLWVDDVRPAPEGYVWCKSVNMTKFKIEHLEQYRQSVMTKMDLAAQDGRYEDEVAWNNHLQSEIANITIIDIDHDAGDYARDGGDYIKLLDWLEETGRNYSIHIHSQNPVGVENMRRIIERNGWREIR